MPVARQHRLSPQHWPPEAAPGWHLLEGAIWVAVELGPQVVELETSDSPRQE